ncbi:MAG: isocitrate/isopropylmalate family dehydrogenase, partial [Candidatus Thermoplasmatota archaeon]|nr:isocitrate/isopropylmalate family dehydrogenase [Candidatus Thermoplasmatota archaeon]
FEPVHGSAPKYAGMNKVNPIASVNSIQMMMDWLGRKNGSDEILQVATAIEQSVSLHLAEGKYLTYDLGGDASCSAVGDLISDKLAGILREF